MRLSTYAGLLGVSEVQAGLSPEQKLAAIQAAQQQGGGIAASARGSGVIMVSPRGVLSSVLQPLTCIVFTTERTALLCAAASDTDCTHNTSYDALHSAFGWLHGAGKDSQTWKQTHGLLARRPSLQHLECGPRGPRVFLAGQVTEE